MSERPPDPGPRPAEFEFPFQAAGRAVAVIEELIARYRSVAELHRAAAERARVDFEGRTRQLFDADLGSVLDECDRMVGELEGQRAQIEGVLGDALRRRQQRQADIDAWELRHREYVNAPT